MTTPSTTKTDLLLLGLLHDRPMHGYELYRQIQAEGIDTWFHVSAPGVYYSLRKLRDQGLVAESQQRGGRSSRKSIYRLTDRGRSAFFEAMEAQLANKEETYLDYDLAIYLLNRLPLQRAIPRLEQRQTFLDHQAQEVEASLAAEQDNGSSPLKLAILDHKRRYLEMEQNWLTDVIRSVRENGTSGDDEAIQRWKLMVLSGDLRHYHLPDLIRLIVSGRHSGTLTLTEGAESHSVAFEEGQPVCIYYQRRDNPSAPPPSAEQSLDRLCELFHRQEGRFTFDQRLDCKAWGVPLQCSAQDLILRGCRRVEDWTIIQRLVPSAETIFESDYAAHDLEHLALTATEGQVVAAVDGTKDVTAIARELDLTLFEASRVFYCLAAIGVLRTADLDKIRLRRVFREIAELMCDSTIPWRPRPDDRSCEQELNEQCKHLPIRLQKGRIIDRADPQLGIDELQEMYRLFLRMQFRVIGRRFGQSNAHQAFERTLRQLAPELQDIAKRYGFDRLKTD
jgi:DNA-binding PadR family transcriptional regulator